MTNARPDRRNALIRLIHVAKRDRQLDDATYRDILNRETGKSSCNDMSEADLDKALRAFKRTGFNVKHSRPAPEATSKMRKVREGQAALITALWIDLWQLGAVHDNSDKALDAFVERQAKVAHMRWLTPANANRVIEALKDWCMREGFHISEIPEGPNFGLYAKRALCRAIYRKLIDAGAPREDFEGDLIYIDAAPAHYAERLANGMGVVLRDWLKGNGA